MPRIPKLMLRTEYRDSNTESCNSMLKPGPEDLVNHQFFLDPSLLTWQRSSSGAMLNLDYQNPHYWERDWIPRE
ncbi:hypothetical protein VTN77DRAFT_8275 [Rasamsonia byssochlamydoides]|uniref:uncharacterized protein n=1 Tax=Rasamsonia byssochlamydoides TaxID=89139 RepID=UPI0037442922